MLRQWRRADPEHDLGVAFEGGYLEKKFLLPSVNVGQQEKYAPKRRFALKGGSVQTAET